MEKFRKLRYNSNSKGMAKLILEDAEPLFVQGGHIVCKSQGSSKVRKRVREDEYVMYYISRKTVQYFIIYKKKDEQECLNYMISEIAAKIGSKEVDKEARKEEVENAIKNLEIGDVFKASWGYDCTFVDWYKLTNIKNKKLTFEVLKSKVDETGFMSGTSKPGEGTGRFIEKIARKTFIEIEGSRHISLDSPIKNPEEASAYCSWYN